MLEYLASGFLLSAAFSYLLLAAIIQRLKKLGISGQDVNKAGKPKVAEMGGIGIVAGMVLGVLALIFFNTFMGFAFGLDFVLAALVSIFALAFIGFVDDILDIPQAVKALLPLLAGIPLIALRAAGSTAMDIPFGGVVDLGLAYLFVLIPVGIAVSSNLTNMLAGFNGMEAGMGIMMLLAGSIVAYSIGSVNALVLYVPLMGALLGFLLHNFYPARVFPGDVGTFIIGGTLACGAIIGNFESIAALLMGLYVLDFFIKAANGFPKTPGAIKEGKLYAPRGRITGLVHVPMKALGGIGERELVLLFIFAQALVGALVLLSFHVKVL